MKGALEKHGAAVAALAAGLAALPGVGLPFLSDDWALLGALRDPIPWRTPFAYVRPLSTAWLWLDLKLFAASPALVHLSTAVLMAVTAAVLVVLLRRLTGDARLAAVAGLVFALHPYHIENAAWIAARPDVLCALLAFLAIGAHDRWLERGRGLPLTALALLEASLLAKESAVTLPLVALLLGFARVAGRPPAGRVLRGAGALGAVALLHFLVLWPWLAGRSATGSVATTPRAMLGKLADFVSAALFAAPTDVVEARPRLWFLAAVVLFGLVVVGARSGGRKVPAIAGVAALLFLVALFPALISFQARYLYLPGAAAAVGIASLGLSLRPRWRTGLVAVIGVAWAVAALDAWSSWYAAGRVSRALVAETVAAAATAPGESGIYLVNVPHRVRGAPVFADLAMVTALGTGRPVPVRYAALIDYAGADAPGLDRSAPTPVWVASDAVTIELAAPQTLRSGLVWPKAAELAAAAPATLVVSGPARLTAHLPTAAVPVESIWYWSEGHLHRVAEPAPAPR